MEENYYKENIIEYKQKETLQALKLGEIENLRVTAQMPIDDIVSFGLDEDFLKQGLTSFPDPRKNYDIPIEVLLLPQVIQRLDDEHSLVNAPYMLNSAELIAKLGYSPKVLEAGFNDKNIHKRETIFHGDTLRHVLKSVKADQLVAWYNSSWNNLLKNNSPGRTRQYLIDGTNLYISKHLLDKYEGAGVLKTAKKKSKTEFEYKYGYKVVWIQEVIDRKGIIRAMKFAPINVHDLVIGKELVDEFPFEEGSLLTMDKGFIDGDWVTKLKTERGIDTCMPLRNNSEVTTFAKAEAIAKNDWIPHPTREKQRIRELEPEDLITKKCSIFKSGVLVNFTKKNGEEEYITFVDTREEVSGKRILATYDLRSEIEESHRQMKCFQGLENLPSKRFVNVVFRIIMGTISYNLFNLFLNSEKCEDLDAYSLKTHRQKRKDERNPDVIIYTGKTFCIIKNLDFLKLILSLKKKVQKKLFNLFSNLSRCF
jgi:hypothetical protein